jgi:SNF2 family DNA or RNA helicase
MGAGKSRIVVDYLQNTPPGPTVILCPLKVAPVWPAEFAKYTVEQRPILLLDRGSVPARAALARENTGAIVIVNYDAARMAPLNTALLSIPWQRIILDECHRIKTAGGQTSRFVARLCKPCPKIIGLSGTPLTTGQRGTGGKLIGGWLDMYGQARAIAPQFYGTSHANYKHRYGRWMTEPFPKLLDDLNQPEWHAKLDSFCFHVGADELAYTLPEFTDQVVPVTLPQNVLKSYRQLEDQMIAEWEDESISASNALVKQLRLQQMAGGHLQPDTGGPVEKIHDEKFDAIAELLADMTPDEKVVIFCKFRPEIRELGHRVIQAGRTPYHLIGGEDSSEQWKSSNGGVILVQISAGSEGVDLTAARYCIYCSLCHSLKDYQQSRKRLHRPGQTRPVTYYHIVASGTIDDDIYAALDAKESVVDSVRQRLRERRSDHGYQDTDSDR